MTHAQAPAGRALSRWTAIVALFAATAGIIVAIGFPLHSEVGFALVAGGMALAIWLPLIGPLRLTGRRIVDEFERMIQTRAWLAGFAAASFAAVLGILMLLALGMAGHWERLTLLLGLRSLLTYLIVVLSAVPTLVIVSGPPVDADD